MLHMPLFIYCREACIMGNNHKGKFARGKQSQFLHKSQKIMHLAAEAKMKSPEICLT